VTTAKEPALAFVNSAAIIKNESNNQWQVSLANETGAKATALLCSGDIAVTKLLWCSEQSVTAKTSQ